MVAKITLEMDDRTAQGFADVVRNATSAEDATQELGRAMAGLVEADETIEGLKMRLGELEGKLGSVGKTAKQTGQAGGSGMNVILDGLGIVSPAAEQTVRDFHALGQSLGDIGPIGGKAFGMVAKSIPFVGLALGGASLAMHLFGDDAAEAGEKATRAAEETAKAWEDVRAAQREAHAARERLRQMDEAALPVAWQLRNAQNELAKAEQDRATAERSRLQAENELNAATRTTLQLQRELAELQSPTRAQFTAEDRRRQLALQDEINRATDAQVGLQTHLAQWTERVHEAAARAADAEAKRRDLAAELAHQTQEQQRATEKFRDLAARLGMDIHEQQSLERAGLTELIERRQELERTIQKEIDALAELKDEQEPNLERAEELLDSINNRRRDHAQLLSREKALQLDLARVEQAREQQRQRDFIAEMRRRKAEMDARAEQHRQEVEQLVGKLGAPTPPAEGGPGEPKPPGFDEFASKIHREDLVTAIAAQRRLAGEHIRRGGRELNREQLEREARRDLARGEVDPAELQRAQANVMASIARKAQADGKLDQRTADAFKQIADNLNDAAQEADDHERRIQQMESALKGQFHSRQRARAQRRGNRG